MFDSLNLNSAKTYYINLPLNKELLNKCLPLLPFSLQAAHPKRKDEYIAGRLCVEKAISSFKEVKEGLEEKEDLGVKKFISRGINGDPLWPKYFVGSISHTNGIALASVAKRQSIKSIGIDIEGFISNKKFNKLSRMFTRIEDLSILSDVDNQKLSLAQTLIFCSKESLYKALYPIHKKYFGFKEAFVQNIDYQKKSFTIVLDTKNIDLINYNVSYFGTYDIIEDKLITSIEILDNDNE